MRKGKYTSQQIRAFERGKGYRAGEAMVIIPYKNADKLASFRAGYKKAGPSVAKMKKRGK